jgi:hypothetical protein
MILVCFLVACGADKNGGGDPDTPDYTYYKDIAPVVERSCSSCHVQGGSAPFPLDNYDALYTVRELAREKVSKREMPPWFTSRECANYENDKSLSDEEIAMFEAWVDQGSPEGDPADAPPNVEDTAEEGGRPTLDHVDLTLEPAEPYYPTSTDEVHCFNLMWPLKEEMFITALNVVPTDQSLLHHITMHLVDPKNVQEYIDQENRDPDEGYVCEDLTGAVDTGTQEIGGWTGGSTATIYPDGTGQRIEPGSIVQLQTHYTITAEEVGKVFDQTKVQFQIEKDAVEAYLTIVLDPAMKQLDPMIPKDDPDVLLEGDVHAASDIPTKFWVTGAGFHMHYISVGGGVSIKHADGTEDCILDLTGWDPDWQQAYDLAEPLLFDHLAGDEWHLWCEWDNSQENQPIIGGVQRPSIDIVWGTTLDMEMCRSSVHITGIPDDGATKN